MKTNELVPPAVKLSRIPMSRNEYLDRKAKLWSLVQAANPETANLEEIAAEKAALDAYENTHRERARQVLAAKESGTSQPPSITATAAGSCIGF